MSENSFQKTTYGCTCTCCHKDGLLRCDCVIFIRKNYDFSNRIVATALLKRYREPRNKEFICNMCHKQLKSGIFVTHKEHSKSNNTQSSHNSTKNNKHHFDSTSLHATQNPQVTNRCLCTCCHKPDILRKQCVIFNIQRYNMNNQMVSQALSSRISIPTAKEFICKKCDKSLRFGQMPMDAEVPYNYKHLNKGTLCISCKTETGGKIHIFDQAEYGENILTDKIVPSDIFRRKHYMQQVPQ